MKITTFHRSLIALSVMATALVSANIVSAQAPNGGSGQALEIAPPVVTVTAKPGEAIKAQITIRNVAPTTLIAKNEINDFVAAGEDGTPKLLLDKDQISPYSMKSWIAPIPQMTLKSKQLVTQPVNIVVPANAAPGGYYAVIRFTATPAGIDTSGVSLSASLGALVMLRVQGDAKEALSVEEFAVSKNGQVGTLFEATPLRFIARVKNEGNVHEQPVGQIVIRDMFGRTAAAVNVNLEQRNVLPQSIRRFEGLLDKGVIGDKFMFGRYSAKLTFKYGPEGKMTTVSNLNFWIIPWKLIIVAIAGVIIAFFLLRSGLRRYNDYIIGRSRGGGGRSRRR